MKEHDLSYRQMRMQIRARIMSTLTSAEEQNKQVNAELLGKQMELDFGVGRITVERIIANLKSLGFVEVKGGIIKKTDLKASAEAQDEAV